MSQPIQATGDLMDLVGVWFGSCPAAGDLVWFVWLVWPANQPTAQPTKQLGYWPSYCPSDIDCKNTYNCLEAHALPQVVRSLSLVEIPGCLADHRAMPG